MKRLAWVWVLLAGCGGSSAPPLFDASGAPDAPAPTADAGGAPADASRYDSNPPLAACTPAMPCSATGFCDYVEGCGLDGASGLCQPRPPDPCPQLYYPVCGCDRMTYGNICEANTAGVDVLYEGECPTMQCGGFAGLACDPGFYCDWTPNSCGSADQLGDCLPMPLGCPDVYDPVCACDGMTYGNACDAHAAGMDIIHTGACT